MKKEIYSILYLTFLLLTYNVGFKIHGSIKWAIFDTLFAPIAWIKWMILHEVNLTLIKESINWFLK